MIKRENVENHIINTIMMMKKKKNTMNNMTE